jgi:hypothetical protein
MFDTLSDDLLTNITIYCTVPEMFAMFCASHSHSARSQEVLDRRYKTLRIERVALHRFHFTVRLMMENWRLEKAEKLRRASIPVYNNARRLRTDDTPVLMF